MKNLLSIKVVFIFLVLFLYSCSKDDEPTVCLPTAVNLTINGEKQSFQAIGRGIDLRQNGYELHLNLGRYSLEPYREQTIYIQLPYKKTGKNSIEVFQYHQYINQISFSGDFLNGDFESNVITNTSTCFYATFSGTLSDGNQQIVITEGSLSYKYEESFDE